MACFAMVATAPAAWADLLMHALRQLANSLALASSCAVRCGAVRGVCVSQAPSSWWEECVPADACHATTRTSARRTAATSSSALACTNSATRRSRTALRLCAVGLAACRSVRPTASAEAMDGRLSSATPNRCRGCRGERAVGAQADRTHALPSHSLCARVAAEENAVRAVRRRSAAPLIAVCPLTRRTRASSPPHSCRSTPLPVCWAATLCFSTCPRCRCWTRCGRLARRQATSRTPSSLSLWTSATASREWASMPGCAVQSTPTWTRCWRYARGGAATCRATTATRTQWRPTQHCPSRVSSAVARATHYAPFVHTRRWRLALQTRPTPPLTFRLP